jgi:hypothetical protein
VGCWCTQRITYYSRLNYYYRLAFLRGGTHAAPLHIVSFSTCLKLRPTVEGVAWLVWKQVQVERLLEDRALDTSGNKDALMERLLAAQGEAAPGAEEETSHGPEIVSVSRQV